MIFRFAQIADEAGVDAILVGDSLAMVVQGMGNTIGCHHGRNDLSYQDGIERH